MDLHAPTTLRICNMRSTYSLFAFQLLKPEHAACVPRVTARGAARRPTEGIRLSPWLFKRWLWLNPSNYDAPPRGSGLAARGSIATRLRPDALAA